MNFLGQRIASADKTECRCKFGAVIYRFYLRRTGFDKRNK